MVHNTKTTNLNRSNSHFRALLVNLYRSLQVHGAIKTTLRKAELLKDYAQKYSDAQIRVIKLGHRKGDNAQLAMVANAEYLTKKFQPTVKKEKK